MEKSHFQRLLTLINLGVITSLHSPRTVRGRVSSAGRVSIMPLHVTILTPNICTTVLLPHVKTDYL
jgi:hypothetical protein